MVGKTRISFSAALGRRERKALASSGSALSGILQKYTLRWKICDHISKQILEKGPPALPSLLTGVLMGKNLCFGILLLVQINHRMKFYYNISIHACNLF
jgi:hypothetical protein